MKISAEFESPNTNKDIKIESGDEQMKKITIAIIVFMLMLIPIASATDSTHAAPKDFVAKAAAQLNVQGANPAPNGQNHCYQADESYAVYHNGLWWAWLAPVAKENWSGQGITPDPSLIGDGWRNVSGETEWALRPEPTVFRAADKCAARTFFSPAPWCDWNDPYYVDNTHPNGYLTYFIDDSVAEYWVVHDDCGIPANNQVPEFGIIGALTAIAAIGGFALYRRKH